MTGMAQGADLLVARAAVKAGCKVDAVLPMPLERYVEDFEAESGAALRALLADPAVTLHRAAAAARRRPECASTAPAGRCSTRTSRRR